MNKSLYYITIFVITLVTILVIGVAKLAIDYAIITAVLAFLVLVAIKNS
jgi:hypothetical protein